jgi:hypothetical protein
MNGLGEMELELEGLGEFETEAEGEFESEFESELEFEAEGEAETEFELEGPNPVTKVYPDAMMEHMGLAAMESENEFEAAEHFLPLVPLVASKLLPLAAKALPKVAAKVVPRIAKVVSRATPHLTKAVGHLTRTLHRNPHTRQLVRVIPSVTRRAVTTLAKHAAKGHSISPRQAVRILGKEHRRVLHNPQIVKGVLHRARRWDHRFHPYGRYAIGPHGRYSVTGAPARHAHLYGRAGYPSGRGVCPTCGTTMGMRRSCCCC